MAFSIRLSRPGEGERLVAIWRAAVQATHDFLLPEDRTGIDADARAYLLSTPLWVAADADDRPIAFMGLGEARLDALFVAPEHRGKGVGRALVRFAAARHPTLDTEVNVQNGPAVGFYRRLGFVETGRAPTDDHGRPYPLIRMRLDFAVRLARGEDIAAFPGIEQSAAEAFRDTPHAWVADDGVTEVKTYPPLIAGGTLWVAEKVGDPVGFVSAVRAPDALHVLELAVRRDHQRRGVGRRLMQALIDAARSARLPAVTLTTFRDVAFNAPFYQGLGFEILDRPSPRLRRILAAETERGLTHRCAMRLPVPRDDA